MEMNEVIQESKGFYKLNWLQRIGFGSGDLAQNLIYQTIGMYLLLFYTNVYGIDPAAVAVMFLVVRLVDVLWDPLVGTYVDKHSPRLGKYRAYLVLGGIPLSGFAILCFWNGFSGSLLYAYVTYVGMSMCYTLVANLGGLAVSLGIPILVAAMSPDGKMNTVEDAGAWFVTMTLYALVGMVLLVFCFTQCKERVVMDREETANVKVSDLWVEFVRNRPLRVLAFFFITAFAMMAIGNSAGSYYMIYNVNGTPSQMSVFMGLGSVPAFIFMPMIPAIKRAIGKKQMFYAFLGIAIFGMALLYVISVVPALRHLVWLVYVAQFVKSTGVIVATGYMWALVPEVISYGEYTTGRRISGIVNALTGIFYKAGMALGGVVPGLILSVVGFDQTNATTQSALAQQGILWLVCVIPALLLLLAIFIISKYELTDDVIDRINTEIENRSKES